MIEQLILYELSKKTLTMYGISKEILAEFSVLTTPSYGTIKPALNRLEKCGFVKTQKTMSQGGRPSTYYSITSEGKTELNRLMLSQPLENPIQFLVSSRIKLACADVLDAASQVKMFKIIMSKAENILLDTDKLLRANETEFFHKMVFDNLVCEYKNFITLLEGLIRACKN